MYTVMPMVGDSKEASTPVRQLEEVIARLGEVGAADPQELRRIGESLISLAHQTLPFEKCTRQSDPLDESLAEEKCLGNLARSMHVARSRRANFLRRDLFAEPAWDLLLDLFANAVERRGIAVHTARLAAGVPAATALRWLGILVSEGLVEEIPVENDRRASEVRLTPAGFEFMKLWLIDAAEVMRT